MAYIFPSTSGCPGNDIKKGIGQVTVAIEGIISTAQRDIAEVPKIDRQKEGINGKI